MVDTLTRQVRAEQRQTDFERFEDDRLRTDEITYASERLNGIMHNTFEYDMHDGEYYFQGQALTPIFDRGIQVAEELTAHKPQFSIELLRRYIERRQLDAQKSIRQTVDWDDPYLLIHISPTPDAVLSGAVELDAYDIKRQKVMVRITEPTSSGIRVTSLSLDGNNRQAVQAIALRCGIVIADDATSEDILAENFIVRTSEMGDKTADEFVRNIYDATMKQQFGGDWFGGRQDSNMIGTMQRIEKFPELIAQHVDRVKHLRSTYGVRFRSHPEYNDACYDLLAAVTQAETLGAVVGTVSDAGDSARSSGVEFGKGDCATGVTAEQALQSQAIGNKEVAMTCPYCGLATYGDPCGFRIVCTKCDAEVRGGRIWSEGIGRSAALARSALTLIKTESKRPIKKTKSNHFSEILAKYKNNDAAIRYEIGLGTANYIVYDKRTNQTLQKI